MSQDNLTTEEIRDLVDERVGQPGSFDAWLEGHNTELIRLELFESFKGTIRDNIDYAVRTGLDPAEALMSGILFHHAAGGSKDMLTLLSLILASGKLTPRHLQLLEGLGLELDFFWAWGEPELATKERDQFLLHQGWAEGFSAAYWEARSWGSPKNWENEPENPYPAPEGG